MKHLTLLRHAKSDWGDLTLSDRDRPLNERGRKAAARMGAFMAESNLVPDHILSSPAIRTRQTLDLMLPHFSTQPEIIFLAQLYLADADVILATAQAAPASQRHILLLGHNPGMQELALMLSAKSLASQTARQRIMEKYPTAALAHFEVHAPTWREAGPGNCTLAQFTTPKDLR